MMHFIEVTNYNLIFLGFFLELEFPLFIVT